MANCEQAWGQLHMSNTPGDYSQILEKVKVTLKLTI